MLYTPQNKNIHMKRYIGKENHIGQRLTSSFITHSTDKQTQKHPVTFIKVNNSTKFNIAICFYKCMSLSLGKNLSGLFFPGSFDTEKVCPCLNVFIFQDNLHHPAKPGDNMLTLFCIVMDVENKQILWQGKNCR